MTFTNRIRTLAAAGAHLLANVHTLLVDGFHYLGTCLRPNTAIVAENLFLRRQLALYQERQAKPRRANNITRLILVWLSRCFDWKSAL